MSLLSINVNEHTEKKNGLTYLSWAWAWAEVLKVDPQATWEADLFQDDKGCRQPAMFLPDGSAMVSVRVRIKGDEKQCLLPVMNHRNQAIKQPDAFAINTAIMRCMTKAISMHGLGLYIYAGEDLPQVDREPTEEEIRAEARERELQDFAAELVSLHEHGQDMAAINAWYRPESWSADNPTRQEEQKYVWGQLKEFSKLRSAIKANSPKKEEQ